MAETVTSIIDAVRGDLHEFTPLLFRDTDLLIWLNDGIQAVASATHAVNKDWLSRRMISTDAAETIHGESYDPSSLRLVADVGLYTLPPNVIQIRSLEPATQAQRDLGTQFLPRSSTHFEFLRQARMSYSQQPTRFYYTAVGVRQIRIVPVLVTGSTSMDVELWYVALPSRLVMGAAFTGTPLQTVNVVKAYMVWRAMRSIDSQNANAKLSEYQLALHEMNSLMLTRNTNDPQFVEGAYDEEDYPGAVTY